MTPKTLNGLRNPNFGGVILLKLFNLSKGFRDSQSDFALKWLFLTFATPKPMLRSKSFRSMTPPKLGFLRPKKVLGVKKSF